MIADSSFVSGSPHNPEWTFAMGLQELIYRVHPDENVYGGLEVFAEERLGGGGAGLHLLEALHGTHEVHCDILDAAGLGVGCSSEGAQKEV